MQGNNKLRTLMAQLMIYSSIPFFVIGIVNNDLFIMWLMIFVLWIGLFSFNLKRTKAMILAFLITFFMFLLGEIFINQFDDTAFHAKDNKSIVHAYTSIYLSLLFFYFGTCFGKWRFVCGNKEQIKTNIIEKTDSYYIQKACKILYIVFGLCSLAEACEKLVLSLTLGSYTATFVDYSSNLPSIVTRLSGMSDMVFFLYLATLPDPRKSKLLFGLKMLISLVLLAFGTRNMIVMTVIIIFIYCIYYENAEDEQYQIIHKSVYFAVIGAIPFVLIFFDFLMAYRDGRMYTSNGMFDSLKHIITSVGGSVNVITYGYEKDALLPDKIYSLGNVIDFFTKNIFARILFGAQQYGGNTIDMALKGNLFSNALTYIVKRSSYLAGYGMGSSYIAETFHDFGYMGVIIINFIYGNVLNAADKLEKNYFIKNTIILMASYNILMAPRAYADGFISCFFNFSFLLTIVLVYIVSNIIKHYIE